MCSGEHETAFGAERASTSLHLGLAKILFGGGGGGGAGGSKGPASPQVQPSPALFPDASVESEIK